MLEQTEQLFADMVPMLKHLKKATYAKNMEEFRSKFDPFFQEMTRQVQDAPDPAQAARDLGGLFVEKVWNAHQKHGRVNGRTQSDLDFFMIYYVFPAILCTEHEQAKAVADGICAAWPGRFKGSNISYASYEEIYNGFRTKILGFI